MMPLMPQGVEHDETDYGGKHVLRVLSQDGDTRHYWDPDNAGEVAAARVVFDSMRAKGYMAYRLDAGGGHGEEMRMFDPAVGEMVLAPPLRGG